MGNVCCGGGGDYEMQQRQELLKEGNDFKKKTPFLGGVLSKTEPIYLQLNAPATRLQWRATPAGSSKLEELAIGRMGKVCPSGNTDLVVLGAGGQKLLELTASTTAIRDLWVQTLDELTVQQAAAANDDETKARQQELAKQTEKHKDTYWKDRTNDMEQRRLDAEERKKKFGAVGMKYTAQAMATR